MLIGSFLFALLLFWDNKELNCDSTSKMPIFGITYHTDLRYESNKKTFQRDEIINDLRTIKNLNIGIVRTDVSWERLLADEATAIEFDGWILDQIHYLGMKAMFIVKTPEQIYLYSSKLPNVDFWQIANEPNTVAFNRPLRLESDEEVINYLFAQIRLVKSTSPKSVILINPVDLPKIRGFVETSWIEIYQKLLDRGVQFDQLGLDSYPGGPYQLGYASDIKRSILITRKFFEDAGQYQPNIWIIETGSPSGVRTLNSQARYIQDAICSAVSANAVGIIIYEAFDDKSVSSEVSTFNQDTMAIEQNFGLIYNNRTLKPGAIKYQTIIHHLASNLLIFPSTESKLYLFIGGVSRLIMPTGGPITLSELVYMPNWGYAAAGLLIRLGLRKQKVKKLSYRTKILSDLSVSFLFICPLIFFQIMTNTQASLWYLWLGYSLLLLIYIWCGVSQMDYLNRNIKNQNTILAISSFLPVLIGFGISYLFRLPSYGWFLFAGSENLLLLVIQNRFKT